jgi:hypothetical protein
VEREDSLGGRGNRSFEFRSVDCRRDRCEIVGCSSGRQSAQHNRAAHDMRDSPQYVKDRPDSVCLGHQITLLSIKGEQVSTSEGRAVLYKIAPTVAERMLNFTDERGMSFERIPS